MPVMRNMKANIITEENLVQRKASLTQDKPLLEDHQNEPCTSQVEEKQNDDLVSSAGKTIPLGTAPMGASNRPSILPEHHKENMTVFSIHLVRSEDAGRSSQLRGKGKTEKPRPLSCNFEKISATISATPAETSLNSTLQLDASFDADEAASAVTNTSTESNLHSPQRTSTPLFESNGVAVAPSTSSYVDEVGEQPVQKSVARKVANVVLSAMLLFLLLVALLIALFENEASWVEQFPALESARHEVYEPCRHYILNTYRRYFSK
uniref:Consortin_C domain-containing protein n=1 Tax=Steinernema glaseri TaxID=37863 RepID=A0A1I7YNX0_9BILA